MARVGRGCHERACSTKRGRPLSVPRDRRLRVPVELSHRRARRPGRIGRLALRAEVRFTQRVRRPARSPGRQLPAGSLRRDRPQLAHYEPGTNTLVTTWNTRGGWVVVRDALTMGPRTGEDRVTPYTRPPADDGADHMLVRTVQCIEGQVEIELSCDPVFEYGRTSATWTLSGRRSLGRCRRRRPGDFACRAASLSASRAIVCVAATRSPPARRCIARCLGPTGWPPPRHRR